MTREERQYFYNKLVQLFNNWANEHINDSATINSKMIESFVDRYMTTITGQQLLPQDVFRVFLNELSPMIANLEQSAGGGTMEESFTTNMTVGGIDAGTRIDASTKINELLKNMLFAYIKPDVTISISQYVYEVGKTARPSVTYKATDSSSAKVTKIVLKKNNTVIHTLEQVTSGMSYTYPDSNVTSDTTYSIAVYDDVKGDASNTKEMTVSFKYQYFYGSQDSAPENARVLTGNFSRPSSVMMTDKKWFLYVPKSYSQPTSFKTLLEVYSIEDETTTNENKKGVILKKLVTVKDAGGNDAEYYRYMMQLDNPLGSNINIG